MIGWTVRWYEVEICYSQVLDEEKKQIGQLF